MSYYLKYLVSILIFFSLTAFTFNRSHSLISPYQSEKDQIKQEAFTVLNAKCNACHKLQKPDYIFTLNNMNAFAETINKQVFIKKKMPKGKDFTLTTQESNALKVWLDNCLTN